MNQMNFYIDPSSKDNLYLQIKKQIEYWIATGQLNPGDRLPTIRDLEKRLGVNRHTVRRAYLDLEAQGLLRVQRGRGVTVAPGGSGPAGAKQDPALNELVEDAFRAAADLGYGAATFARRLQQHAPMADRRNPSIAFVECSATQARDLAGLLQTHLGQAVIGVDLRDLERDPAVSLPASVQHVVVPAFHAHLVVELVGPARAQTITVPVEVGQRFVNQATAQLPAARPGMLLRDREAIPLYPEMVKELLHLETDIALALIEDPRAVERLIAESDLIFCTPPCKEFADRVVPDDKKQQEVLFEFTPDALELIRHSVGR